ncbi:MAG: glycosyltransferase [Lachnospiraceae bacterium]
MSKINLANLKKTYYYCKKNGLKQAVLAAVERMFGEQEEYFYEGLSEQELEKQRETTFQIQPTISIVVPLYNTPREYFCQMVESVRNQTYTKFELVLADASTAEYLAAINLEEIVSSYGDERIIYKRLEQNMGISENTNSAIDLATGEYIGLLDHDDILTLDALFEVVTKINNVISCGERMLFLYSDEDKCDGDMSSFYDPNIKPTFDLDYLWSNNYICHFSVFESQLLKKLRLRKEYDGAQDYDLILRTVRAVEESCLQVHNISKVLYHWRCHVDSTAVNPQSKLYAYEAGKRALEDDLRSRDIRANVMHSKHLGFYQVHYMENLIKQRSEVGMIAKPGYERGRIVSGARDASGALLYGGLLKGFSGGYLHRAAVFQQCFCADIDARYVRDGLLTQFLVEASKSEEYLSTIEGMVAFGTYLQKQGYVIVYSPEME